MANDGETFSMSIPTILDGLADEMQLLVAQGMKLELAVTQLLGRADISEGVVEGLQSLDVVLQHLNELQSFMAALAEGARNSDTSSIDRALEALKLHGLYSRLAHVIGGGTPGYASAPSGDLELL